VRPNTGSILLIPKYIKHVFNQHSLREGAQDMMLRSFIAVEIPPNIQSALAHSTAVLQKALPKPLVRWVPPHNVHLTLKFLGDVSPANLELLAETLKVEMSTHKTFRMVLGGLGAFPNKRRARVIWIGIEAPTALTSLVHSVEAVTKRLGFPSEQRPFSPHLTIGRVGPLTAGGDIQRICSALEGTVVDNLGTVDVNAVQIFKSDLLPGGSVYTRLYTLPLKPT
jgi:RNA 2',3'-cyclic 3'-phosphodiesterase